MPRHNSRLWAYWVTSDGAEHSTEEQAIEHAIENGCTKVLTRIYRIVE